MTYKEIKQIFVDNFNEFSKEYLFTRDFYNLTKSDKYEIAKDTFYDVAEFIDDNYPQLKETERGENERWFDEYFDNIVVNYMEMLG